MSAKLIEIFSSPAKSMGPIVKQFMAVAVVVLDLRRSAPPAVSAPNAFTKVPVPVLTVNPAPAQFPLKRSRPAWPLDKDVCVVLAPLVGKVPPIEPVAREVNGTVSADVSLASVLKSK